MEPDVKLKTRIVSPTVCEDVSKDGRKAASRGWKRRTRCFEGNVSTVATKGEGLQRHRAAIGARGVLPAREDSGDKCCSQSADGIEICASKRMERVKNDDKLPETREMPKCETGSMLRINGEERVGDGGTWWTTDATNPHQQEQSNRLGWSGSVKAVREAQDWGYVTSEALR